MGTQTDVQLAVESQVQMIKQLIAGLRPQIQKAISGDVANNLERIYLVG